MLDETSRSKEKFLENHLQPVELKEREDVKLNKEKKKGALIGNRLRTQIVEEIREKYEWNVGALTDRGNHYEERDLRVEIH